MEGYIVSLIIFAATFALFALGLNLQWGFTGLINFGHVAFMTVGAYATALLSLNGVPIVIAIAVGVILAALLGLLIGISTLRLREDYLAIVTIGVAEIIRLVVLNEEEITRGPFGVQRYPIPLEGIEPSWFVRVVMIGLLTIVVGLGLWNLWRWLGKRLRQTPTSAIAQSSLAVLVYLGTLGLGLYGVSRGVQAMLVASNSTLQTQIALLLLLIGIALVGGIYAWIATKLPKRFSAWNTGLSLISILAISGVSLWVYSLAASALYNYTRNPVKTGLMLISVLLVALVFWRLEWLVQSPWGRVLKSIREDEEVAKALGKNVFWYKLQSLMLGGMIAGLAGSLYAWQVTTIYPDNFQPLTTFNAWIIVVLGGAGSNPGTLLGAAIFWAYDTLTRFYIGGLIPPSAADILGAYRVMIIGLILMVLMILRPQGILGNKDELSLNR